MDKCAICAAHGIVIEKMYEWSNINDDIFKSVQKTCSYGDELGYDRVYYDADGMGIIFSSMFEKEFFCLPIMPLIYKPFYFASYNHNVSFISVIIF